MAEAEMKNLASLEAELAATYRGIERDLAQDAPLARKWAAFADDFAKFAEAHPRLPAASLKAHLYAQIAESCEPVVWTRTPFLFETRTRHPWNWGCPDFSAPGSQAYRHRMGDCCDPAARDTIKLFAIWQPKPSPCAGLWNLYGDCYDVDHHCIGYETLLREGFLGIRARIAARPRQNAETRAMIAGIDAVLRIAARFTAAARTRLDSDASLDSEQRRCLALAASSLERVPALPPRTFAEGLAAILFSREVLASIENIGISVLGRPDLLLSKLYADDLAAGRITEAEAEDLVARWMVVHDIKMDSRSRSWPETSTTMVLGGADPATGDFVDTPLTRLFIRVHFALGLMSPKLNCRISASAPQDYLEYVSEFVLKASNNFAFSNDDALVPALVRHGKSLADARRFVNGGCQEPICEGVEHSAGAGYYFNLAKSFEFFFSGVPEPDTPELAAALARMFPSSSRGATPRKPARDPATFEGFYAAYIRKLARMLRQGAAWWRAGGRHFERRHPSPVFSSTLAGCIECGRDYTAGGARYNPTGCALVGLADIVNSLTAIRIAVYRDRFASLDEMRAAVRDDWVGHEALRQRILALPRFGGPDKDVAELARRFAADVTEIVAACRNERGGHFQPSFFVYYFYNYLGSATGALPEGRRRGEPLSQGVAPHRVNAPKSVTDTVAFLRNIDFSCAPGNAVLDFQMPAMPAVTPKVMAALLRASCAAGVPCMQPNIVDVDVLKDAQKHPEAHGALIVRISGLSAVFVKMEKWMQDEMIARHSFAV